DFIKDEVKQLNDEANKNRLEYGERLCRIKSNQARLDETLKEAKAASKTVDELKNFVKDALKEKRNKRQSVKNTKEFKEFRKRLADKNEETVAEIMSNVTDIIAVHDPWSKEVMLDPVVNTKCGHHYSKHSVEPLIKDNMGICCPILGCPNKAYIKPADLKPDPAMAAKIQAQLAQQEEAVISDQDDDL
ncbi:qjt, partial [Drosophila busckii]